MVEATESAGRSTSAGSPYTQRMQSNAHGQPVGNHRLGSRRSLAPITLNSSPDSRAPRRAADPLRRPARVDSPDSVLDLHASAGPFASPAAYATSLDHLRALRRRVRWRSSSGWHRGCVAARPRIDHATGTAQVGNIVYGRAATQHRGDRGDVPDDGARVRSAEYRRYEWKCDALNAPSRPRPRPLGFAFECLPPGRGLQVRNHDTAWLPISDEEWPRSGRRWSRGSTRRASTSTGASTRP